MKISHTSVVFVAAIIVASCVTIVDGAEIPIPRGWARINDERTTFVADNGSLLRGAVVCAAPSSRSYGARRKMPHFFNEIKLHLPVRGISEVDVKMI